MPPHQIQENSQPLHENVPARKEILFNGFFYDVTDFINRHPGGNVIQFYTEKGEDATQAIQQFHFRSMNRIHQILKSFKKRPVSDDESKHIKFTKFLNYLI
jgi:cytochrome b involved in lipid metabolism